MVKVDLAWRYGWMIKVLNLELHKPWILQFARYVMVGVVSNGIGYSIYLAITYLGVPPKLAMTGLYAISASISFIGNRQLSFSHKGVVSKAVVRFIIAHLCGYSINLLLLVLFADKWGYPYQYVQAAAMVIVAIFLFFMFRTFVFPNRSAADKDVP